MYKDADMASGGITREDFEEKAKVQADSYFDE